jgi:CelD/BcsL family acetyltransferase involved in cellulose biosynthesis
MFTNLGGDMAEKISTRVALPDHKNISVEIIDNVEKWEGLKTQWDSLVAQSLSPSIFLTYEFLSSAWKALNHNSRLHILLIKFGKDLLGIVPLKITQRKVYGIPTKTIEPIATAIAERDFFIVLKNNSLFYEAFVNYLSQNTYLWNKLNFFQLQNDHPFLTPLRNTFSRCRGVIFVEEENLVHPCVNISNRWEEYFRNLKPKFSRKLCNSIQNLCAQGDFKVVRINDPDEIDKYLELYVGLEGRSWKTRMKSGITRTQDLFEVHKLMLKACAEKSWAELTFLLMGSQVIAGGIDVIYDKDFIYLQTVYDEAASRYNPGTVLMTINVWRAFEEGLNKLHFMGDYAEYKRNWANDEWQSCNISVRRRLSGEGLAYYGSKWLKHPMLRVNKRIWKWRREMLRIPELPPLTMNHEEVEGENVILNYDDIKRIFFPTGGQRTSPKEESVVCLLPTAEVERLVAERCSARQKHEWSHADEIRNFLTQQGVVVNDTPQGTVWKYSAMQADSPGDSEKMGR